MFRKYLVHSAPSSPASLARTSFIRVVDADVDRVVKVTAKLLGLLLCKGISSNHYDQLARSLTATWVAHTLKGLVNIDSFLCASLEVRNVAFRLAEGHCPLIRNLVSVSRLPQCVEDHA